MAMTTIIGKKIRNPSGTNSKVSLESEQEKLCLPPTAKCDQNDLIMNIFMYKL